MGGSLVTIVDTTGLVRYDQRRVVVLGLFEQLAVGGVELDRGWSEQDNSSYLCKEKSGNSKSSGRSTRCFY